MLKPLCPTCRGLIDPDLADVAAGPDMDGPGGLGVDLGALVRMMHEGGL